jgi:hypothetical protein
VAFNNIISRADVDAFIPEDVATEVLQAAVQSSAALSLFPTVPMSTKTRRMPVLSALPVAYWVNGDTGLKQTTEMAWGGKYLEAEEIAVIVPVPEAVIDDADFDLWGQVQPRLAEAVGRTLDAADLSTAPTSPRRSPRRSSPLRSQRETCTSAGPTTPPQAASAQTSPALFSVVETDGFVVDGFVTTGAYKGLLRNARDANGVLLSEVSGGTIYGVPIRYAMTGLWPVPATAEGIAGDFSQGIIGVRQDLTYKLLDQAVITDDTGRRDLQPAAAGHGGAARRRPLRLPGRERDDVGEHERRDPLPVGRHAERDAVRRRGHGMAEHMTGDEALEQGAFGARWTRSRKRRLHGDGTGRGHSAREREARRELRSHFEDASVETSKTSRKSKPRAEHELELVTLNRVRTPEQLRRLVDVADNGTATASPQAVPDTMAGLAAATSRGRFVVNDMAAPLDGDAYVHPKPPDPPVIP